MNQRPAVRQSRSALSRKTVLLVMGIGEIIGAINLTFLIQFPLAENFQGWPQIFLCQSIGPIVSYKFVKIEF